MPNNGGTEYKILIPTVAVLSVLFILTLVLVGVVVHKSVKRRRGIRIIGGTNGTVDDDFSSTWSADGFCHGPSVREGRLVRNASRHRMKESTNISTTEVIQEDMNLYTAMEDISKLPQARLADAKPADVDGRVSPGIGRAMSYGSHERHIIPPIMKMKDIDNLPNVDHAYMGDSEALYQSPEHAQLHAQNEAMQLQRQSLAQMSNSGDQGSNTPHSSPQSATNSGVHVSPSRSNSSFAWTPVTPRGSVAIFPLGPPPSMPPLRQIPRTAQRASQRTSQGLNHPSRSPPQFSRPEYGERVRTPTPVMTQTSSNNIILTGLAAQLSPKSGRPQMPKIDIPSNTTSVTSRSLASLQKQASSPSDHGSTEERSFSNTLPLSATRAHAESSPDESVSMWSNQISGSNGPPAVRRPTYVRAPSSAVGSLTAVAPRRASITPSQTSDRSDISASPPKFATGPRLYSNLLPQLNPSASASRTSIVSMSSNASSNTTAIAMNGLSAPPPPRESSPPATIKTFSEATSSNSVGARMTRTSILENAPASPLNRQKNFPRAQQPTVSEIKEAPETPKMLSPVTPSNEFGRENRRSTRRSTDRRRASRSRSRHRGDLENGLSILDDDDADEYPRRGSGYMFV